MLGNSVLESSIDESQEDLDQRGGYLTDLDDMMAGIGSHPANGGARLHADVEDQDVSNQRRAG